jgi:polysaccharide export outer membrane protein
MDKPVISVKNKTLQEYTRDKCVFSFSDAFSYVRFTSTVFLQLCLLLFVFTFLLTSCVSYKKQIFFQGLSDTSYVATTRQPEPLIQRGDQLSIIVYTPDMQASTYYNMPMGGGQGGGMQMMNQIGGGGSIAGYLVNENGEIVFPKFGKMNVLGMTQGALQDTLQNRLVNTVKDAVVNVRLLNFRVTFINSNRATTVNIFNNKTNILQFLGSVGGMEWMDKRDGVSLIRQVDSVRTVYKLNFADKSIFQSPGFYLQPNDVVYVEPNNRKYLETNAQLINLFTGVLSAVSIILVLLNTVF